MGGGGYLGISNRSIYLSMGVSVSVCVSVNVSVIDSFGSYSESGHLGSHLHTHSDKRGGEKDWVWRLPWSTFILEV